MSCHTSTTREKRKYIYFHICTLGTYQDVILRMMDKVDSSGLLDEVDELRYGVLGKYHQEVLDMMQRYPKTKCIFMSPDISLYERATLHRLREDCQKMEEEAFILYIHSKGVSSHTTRGVSSQRALELTNIIRQWSDIILDGVTMYRHLCWRELERNIDAVGSIVRDWYNSPFHFSGGFWWTTASHVSKRPLIKDEYLDAEFWIIGNQPNVRYTDINPVKDCAPYSNYCSIEEYRTTVVFDSNFPLVPILLYKTEILSIEIGFHQIWLDCPLPSPGMNIILSSSTLCLSEENDKKYGLFGIKKIVRIRLQNGSILYFLENEMIDILEKS